MTHIMMPTNRGNCPMPVLNNCQNITMNVNYNVFPRSVMRRETFFNVKMIKFEFELQICWAWRKKKNSVTCYCSFVCLQNP